MSSALVLAVLLGTGLELLGLCFCWDPVSRALLP